jgi:excinuclease UvrABC nuclease subunit
MDILFSAPNLPTNTSGVYKMTLDGKWIYIGSSCNLRKRFFAWKHRCKVRKPKNAKILSLLQIATFVSIEVLELCDNDIRLAKELFYIKSFAKNKYLLNIAGLSTPYIKSGINNKKKIASFKDGKLVEIYSSIIEAADNLNVKSEHIRRFFRGERLSVRGMTFKLIDNNGYCIDFKVRDRKIATTIQRPMGIGGKPVLSLV